MTPPRSVIVGWVKHSSISRHSASHGRCAALDNGHYHPSPTPTSFRHRADATLSPDRYIARIFCDVYLGWFNWVQFLAYFCSSLSPVKVTAGQSCWLRLKARVGAIKAFQGRGGTLRCCKCDHISTLYQLQPTEINYSGAGQKPFSTRYFISSCYWENIKIKDWKDIVAVQCR